MQLQLVQYILIRICIYLCACVMRWTDKELELDNSNVPTIIIIIIWRNGELIRLESRMQSEYIVEMQSQQCHTMTKVRMNKKKHFKFINWRMTFWLHILCWRDENEDAFRDRETEEEGRRHPNPNMYIQRCIHTVCVEYRYYTCYV